MSQSPYGEYHPNIDPSNPSNPINIPGTPAYQAHQAYLAQQESQRGVRPPLVPAPAPPPRPATLLAIGAFILGCPVAIVLATMLAVNHGTVLEVAGTFYAGMGLALVALLFLAIRGLVERYRRRT